MRVDYVTVRDSGGESELIIVIPETMMEIRVKPYGSGEGKLVAQWQTEEDDPRVNAALGVVNEMDWGNALVWANPVTIAHLVRDVIENQ